MAILNEKFTIISGVGDSLIDITEKIKGFAKNCNSKNAVINIFSKNACSSIITLSNKKGLGEDFLNYTKNLIPVNWKQDNISQDDSAFACIRASILGRNMTFAVINKELEIPEGQSIVVVDFNIASSDIEIVVSMVVQEV